MKYKVNISILILLLSFLNSFSQEIPKIIPPTPNAYSLGKYGLINPGLFTGTANYEIPIYNFKTKNLEIPIFLSYSSNGIRVNELTSNVGLGWSLNAGGVITRIVRDKPDEEMQVFYPKDDIENQGIRSIMALKYFDLIGNNEEVNNEPDLYMFNFLGRTGKFVFDKDRNIIQVKQNGLLIERYEEIIGGIKEFGFKIIDEKGIKYYFLDKEISIYRTSGGGLSGGNPPSFPAPTAWYLTRIEHPNGDMINFEYDNSNYAYILDKTQSITIPTPFFQKTCNNYHIGPGYNMDPEITNRLRVVGKKLVKIKSPDVQYGEVTFNYNFYHPVISGYQLITGIKVEDNNHKTIENLDFNYLTTPNNRIFLNDITFLDPSKKYEFEYIDPNGLPERLSKNKDYYGYFNGKNNLYRFPDTKDPFLNLHLNFKVFDIGGDRTVDTTYAKTGLLTKISFPTKGYTEIKYEPNTYYGKKRIYPDKAELYLQLSTTSDPNDFQNEVQQTSGTIPFDQTAKFTVNVSFNSNDCDDSDNTGHTAAIIIIEDEQGDDVELFQNSLLGASIAGINSITVRPDTPDNVFYLNLKQGHSYNVTLKTLRRCISSSLSLSYYNQNYTDVNTDIISGGMRVKKQIQKESATSPPVITRYYYGKIDTPNISSGIKDNFPRFVSHKTHVTVCNYGIYSKEYYQTLHSNNQGQFFNNGNTTSYKYVSLSLGGDNFENGGIENEFYINYDARGNVLIGEDLLGTPLSNIGWDNGLKKRTTYFKKDSNNQLIPVKEIVNHYKKVASQTKKVHGFRVNKRYELPIAPSLFYKCKPEDINKSYTFHYCDTNHIHDYENLPFDFKDYPVCIADNSHMVSETKWHPCHFHQVNDTIPNPHALDNLDIVEYTIFSYWYYLYKTIERDYSNNQNYSIEKTTNYYYENSTHKQLTKTSFIDGNHMHTTKLYYPDDTILTQPLLTNAQKAAIDSLKAPSILHPYSKHIFLPLQTERKVDNEIISINRKIFKDWGNIQNRMDHLILPEKIQTVKENKPLSTRIIYHQYDQFGNPLEISKKDGIHIYYIWGYNHTKIIAKILNFTADNYQSLQNYINDAITASDTDTDTASENLLRQKLAILRQHLLPDQQMTGFTYDPLIGVTSITDPKGDTTYYIYDNFNHLKQIKDKDGHILKEYDYHFRDQ